MRHSSLCVLLALALAAAACGGDSGDDDPQLTTTSTAQEPADTEADAATTTTTAAPAPEEPAAVVVEEGTGTATIGDTTWEFTMSGAGSEMCDLDVGDAGLIFAVIMFGTDDTGREIALNISGPLSGDEGFAVQAGSPTLQFERWTADSTVYDNLSGIGGMPEGVGATVQIDGNTVSGSGVFYDDTTLTQVRPTGGPYAAGVLEGTFRATCPAG